MDSSNGFARASESAASVAMSRLGKSLVVAQVTLSLILLIGAGLFVRTLREMMMLDPGFQRDKVLLLTVTPDLTGYRQSDVEKLNTRLVAPELLERLEAVPGVRSASLSSARPFGDRPWWRMPIKLSGAAGQSEDRTGAAMRWVTPRYFETLGISLLRGRPFAITDSATAPRVALINQTMARQYFGEVDPVGRRFTLTSGLEVLGEIEITGVVSDTKTASLREQSAAMFYVPFAQFGNADNLVFEISYTGNALATAAAARREIESLDSNLAISKITTLSELVSASLTQERAIAALSASFGLLALFLAAIGLYGVLAYAVAQRTREIGLRMALGAQPGDVLRLILSQGMKLACAGLCAGVFSSLVVTRLLRSQLFGISPTDPLTFTAIPLLLGSVALFACWLPARRAVRIDPMVALRQE